MKGKKISRNERKREIESKDKKENREENRENRARIEEAKEIGIKSVDFNKLENKSEQKPQEQNKKNKTEKGIEGIEEKKKRIFSIALKNAGEKNREIKKKLKTIEGEKAKTPKKTTNIKKLLKEYTLKAGIETEPEVIRRKIFNASLVLTLVATIIISFRAIIKGTGFIDAAKFILALWIVLLFASIGVCWLIFFVYVDLLIYKRKIEIENVLADFLQLTSANVRAGMPIDKALWYSIRPRFGVLAKEMETVAKETMSGVSLEDALTRFSQKYDSATLKNSISLLIEGINAGGEVGYILDRISNNIQETQIIRREMAANVITYVIFITFASILAAPFLMALSYQLLTIINSLGSQMATEQVPNTMGLSISFSKIAINPSQFRIFAILTLSITSMFSAMIISIIQKGSIKAGLKLIPIYIMISIALFLILIKITSSFFANLF
ncbi:MAG: type II secretion system F family protein [Candidatus Woesearchaeota archaeon]